MFHNVVLKEISISTSVYEVNVESDNYMYYVVSSIGNVDRYHEFRYSHPPLNVLCCSSCTSCKAVILFIVLLIDMSLFLANFSRKSLRTV